MLLVRERGGKVENHACACVSEHEWDAPMTVAETNLEYAAVWLSLAASEMSVPLKWGTLETYLCVCVGGFVGVSCCVRALGHVL